jgi:hypothetical protein
VRAECGEVLETSVLRSMVRCLQTYRDEWSKIVVWPNEKS